ncbi:M23 family metallopeptidase [Leucobacter sp. UCMA 4100]|uniref:M23 family metallopeptidase n=1 Tax=Leucobacter sp. UCMA 4100 TaxID=2810534 RepID=UPI0022EB816F|nr:M23 family metallopeptidase [Leucobacter sp. UCMA 4100]
MDPFISSTNFFKAMMKVPERDSLEPTIVAHRTQANADPYHYTKFWDAAVQIVEGITGSSTGLNQGTGGQVCSSGDLIPGTVNKEGWAKPGDAPVNSEYGPRPPISTPSGLIDGFHTGLDLEAGGCNGPIWAANDGKVSRVYQDSLANWLVVIDHGSEVVTQYVHMYRDGILVNEGDTVKGGQQIAKTGSSGASTGCHLHFEVKVNGEYVNPRDFLAQVGITY